MHAMDASVVPAIRVISASKSFNRKTRALDAVSATILPGECGICVWSPALEVSGNSHAGSLALEMFTSITKLSIF